MAYYDNRQFNNMRNDAIRRTREMYQNSVVNTSHYSPAENYKNENPVQEVPEIPNPCNNNNSSENNHNKPLIPKNIGKIFSGGLDSEKLTIIALIIILAKEGADIKLILALGYILI